MSLNIPAKPQSIFRSTSEVVVPYDNIYVFHDAENCYLPSKIEARDSNNKLINLPNNGGVKFFESVPGVGPIQGAYVYKEIIRTALACKIGSGQARDINIVALDTNIFYHFVISPKAMNTPFYPSESTIKDFVDIGGGNFYRHVPSDTKVNPSWADQKIKEIWDSQTEQCKKSFSREAIKRTLFILISGDRDFAPQIRSAVKTGLDVSIIFSMDSPIRESIFEILKSREWATGNWSDIVRESRKRSQILPNSGSTLSGSTRGRVPSPARPILSAKSDSPAPVARAAVVSNDYTAGRIEANLLYDFIVQWATKKAYPGSQMLAADSQFFFKEYPDVKVKMGSLKLSEFCGAHPDLFDRQNDGKADWIFCIIKKDSASDEAFSDPLPGLKGLSVTVDKAGATFPPQPPDFRQRFTIQIKEFVAFYAKKFLSQAMNDSVVAINAALQVKIAPVYDTEKKWFATIYADDHQGESTVSPQDFQKAENTIRQLLDTIAIDQSLELPGIQPEAVRDNSELRDLALKEKIFYVITNLSKVSNATAPGLKATASAKVDTLHSNQRTIMPEFVRDNVIDIKDFVQCATTLRDYIRSTGSDIQLIHMAAYYQQYPLMKAILKNPAYKLKDFCRAFPHLLEMKVGNDKKEWLASSKYSDDAIHLYSFILIEGELVNGSRRIAASQLGAFYKSHPQDEISIKQGNRKPKAFIQQLDDLFKWEDAAVEVGFGYIYCAYHDSLRIDTSPAVPPKRCNSPAVIRRSPEKVDEVAYKRSSTPTSIRLKKGVASASSPDNFRQFGGANISSSTSSAKVVLVYLGTNAAATKRFRQFMQSLCRITEQYTLQDKVYIQMCKTAWLILSATMLDVKVETVSTRDSFTIAATGVPAAARSYIEAMKERVGTIEPCLLKVPANKQGSIGLLYGLRQKSNELLSGDDDEVTAGYTSCYLEVESQKTVKSVVVSFLPPWDSNVDQSDERQAFNLLVETMNDVIASYDEAVCPSHRIRKGIKVSEAKGKFSLYYVNFDKTTLNLLLCGESQSVKAAVEWLTVVPALEKECSQTFRVSDGRVAFLLRNSRYAKVLDSLKRAVVSVNSTGRFVAITELVGRANSFTALFAVKGPTALVESAIAEGRSFINKWEATFLDRPLMNKGQDLSDSQMNFLMKEGSPLVKKISNDFGISLKFVSANNSKKEDNQKESAYSVVLFAKIGSIEIRVAQGDMLRVECDAIVNPANSRLSHRGGVARVITEAAGPLLNNACADILLRFGGTVPITEAVVTDSYELKRLNKYSKIVVHSVGPVYSTGSDTEIECYQQAIINALDKAAENGATYIAMPLIGSGIFHWPVELAARQTLGAISKWIGRGNSCKRIILVDIEEDKAAAMVNAVQLFNEKIAPVLISNSIKAAAATATAMKVPHFSWYWEIYSHERDPQGNLLWNHPDALVTAGGAHWIPYDYDQVLHIEAGLANDSFPVMLKGDVGGVTNNSCYLIHKGNRPLRTDFRHVQSPSKFYQENPSSPKKFTRPVLQGESFDPTRSSMHGYNKGAVFAVHDAPVVDLSDAVDSFPLVEEIRMASEVVKKEGFEILGPKDQVLSAENAIQAALTKAVKESTRSFDLQMSEPEDWLSVLQRLRSHLLDQQSHATVVDASSSTAPRNVIIQAVGGLALAQAEKEVMNFVLLISLERSADLTVKWPDEWTGGPFSVNADNNSTTLVPVDQNSDEWQRVEREWRKTGHPSRAISAELLKVERVQNVMAWDAYYSRVRLLAGRNKETLPNGTSVFRKANEQWMKHGTRTTLPEIIYSGEQGLDCRYCGRGLFGIAAYTAEDALYSDSYRYNLDDGTTQMFLVRVAAGNIYEVASRTEEHKKLPRPPNGFDSVRGCVREPNFMAIMVYQPDSAYPAYLLTYKTNL